MTSPEHLIRQILLYLQAHPEAKDTVEGIRTWWITKGEDVSLEHMTAVIEELVRKGWLVERKGVSSPTVYGINTTARTDVTTFLERRPSPSPDESHSRTTT